MMTRTISGALFLVLILIVSSGCTQPEKTPVPVITGPEMHTTPVASILSSAEPTGIPDTTIIPVNSTANATRPTTKSVTTAPSLKQPVTGGYIRFSGPEYSVEYPASWSTNQSRLPLYEYRHDLHGCNAAPAYNLDRDIRAYSSPDGSMAFFSSLSATDRDIWPHNLNGQVAYEDIVNSVIGTRVTCANSPEGAFTIAGISQVPLDGVSFTGTRADYAKINSTGFTDGTGTIYVVTGRQHRGVFLFYRSSGNQGIQDSSGDYIFGSLRLDPGF
ncbi:hypothetical protein [Methanoregula sp. PtaU1.Bin006]|uniref:hypothetical protein n=1 Tax=Methanoregula sp. PtaU1.Bin006 TaxID=1811681 RepID=UPI0025E85BB1|nr:hypothetical protein [Methanoregula sp. PtaU1.Bin006]